MTTLKLFGLGMLLLICQALANEIFHVRIRPNPLLLFALAMGLRSVGVGPLFLSFMFGFALDVLSGSPPGLYALLCGTACAVTRLFDQALYLRAVGPWMVYVLVYALVDGFLPPLVLSTLRPEVVPDWYVVMLQVPGSAFVTALCAGPVLLMLRRIGLDSEPEANWASVGPRSRL